ncbi:GNAT family N-acetyltransferase [Roseivirga misakiensis]|uniref:N-acetyltransferase domain-containing protein n=1 Tax=Roseivirga misakiensis TaxID=1563681 RepID=A0A1E5T188_9BACT|nr:GNAT family N-acetyltransferase [Roseivirga misakiensis]OEK05077.1 hypothetical protein BFP71_16805 [Roseivirga misakiensis]
MITITKASAEDYAEIHQMILDFATFQKTPEKVSITLEDMKANIDDFKSLIIRDGEQAVGFATYYFGFSSWSGRHLFLDDLYLETDYRRQGLGERIMDTLETIANDHKCKSMRWLVSKWNDPAIAFYKKRGAEIDQTELTCMLKLS